MTEKHLIYFLNESIKKSNDLNHHPKLTIMHNEVTVEAYTHDLNDVSELDLDLTRFMDEIYEDIVYLNRA